MPLTPEQIAKIRQKDAATPEALKRNPLSKYTEGWFHVTLNVRGEAPVLGYIMGNAEAADGSENAPRCVLTELGKRVEEEWRGIGRFYPDCICDEVIAMPEHIHALLHLLPTNKAHLGRIINGLMIGCTHAYWDTLGIPWRKMRQEIDEALKRNLEMHGPNASTNDRDKALSAQWQDRDHTCSYRGPSLFVRGYNDVEAIGEEEVETKRQYIRNNPRKRLITRSKPDLFLVHRNMTSANWTPERIMKGLCADRFIAADRNRQVEAWRQLTTKGMRNRQVEAWRQLTTKGMCNRQVEAWRQLTTKGMRNSRGKVSATLKFQTQAIAANYTANGVMANEQTLTRLVIDLVGNMELLRRPLFPLVCHRADAHLFEQQKAAVLKVAREQGGVIVTACISPKERDIVKLLQQELLPVIEVMAGGFGDRYKPTGKAFYAVAEQRRLEVSPWEYEYQRREMCPEKNEQGNTVLDVNGKPEMAEIPDISREMRPEKDEQGNTVLDANGKPEMAEIPDISREMCMVMNELVRLIAQKPDDWWKNNIEEKTSYGYKGQ